MWIDPYDLELGTTNSFVSSFASVPLEEKIKFYKKAKDVHLFIALTANTADYIWNDPEIHVLLPLFRAFSAFLYAAISTDNYRYLQSIKPTLTPEEIYAREALITHQYFQATFFFLESLCMLASTLEFSQFENLHLFRLLFFSCAFCNGMLF